MPKELDASLARLGTGFQRICIPGARNGTQAAENAGALTFSLTQAEIEALDNATLAWRG
jgi:aryl-alcohol dehydrogenase-like predicted oxidoreductase